jgi:hypothetical protein
MSLFNYIKIGKGVKLPIPQEGIDPVSIIYQTKDLGEDLSSFLIENDELFELTKNDWFEEIGSFPEKEVEFAQRTAIIRFYSQIHDVSETEDAWLEYEAIFIDGILARPIKLVKFEKKSNQVRKDFAIKYKLDYNNEKKLEVSYRKYYIYTYRWFKLKIRNIIFDIANRVYLFSQFLLRIALKIK